MQTEQRARYVYRFAKSVDGELARLLSSYYNVSAMLANQRITIPGTILRPLRNVTTNQPIPSIS
jgi:hypothetical protein